MTHLDQVKEMLKGAIALIEEGLTVYPEDCTVGYAPTGDYFLTYTSGGLKIEGQAMGVWCATEAIALRMLLNYVMPYKKNHPGILFWRSRPAVHMVQFLKPVEAHPLALNKETTMAVIPMYYAWCRLVISGSPILEKEELEKLRGGKTLGANANTHSDSSQPNEGRGNGKLEGH